MKKARIIKLQILRYNFDKKVIAITQFLHDLIFVCKFLIFVLFLMLLKNINQRKIQKPFG